MARERQASKRIVIGRPAGADDPDAIRRAAAKTPRPISGKQWFFVTGHYRPVFLTGTEPYIRRWPDGTPMLAAHKDDTIATATERRLAGERADAPAATTETPQEVEHDG